MQLQSISWLRSKCFVTFNVPDKEGNASELHLQRNNKLSTAVEVDSRNVQNMCFQQWVTPRQDLVMFFHPTTNWSTGADLINLILWEPNSTIFRSSGGRRLNPFMAASGNQLHCRLLSLNSRSLTSWEQHRFMFFGWKSHVFEFFRNTYKPFLELFWSRRRKPDSTMKQVYFADLHMHFQSTFC